MSDLLCKLDWFSFTFPIGQIGEGDNEYTLRKILLSFHDHTNRELVPAVSAHLWTWLAPVGHYKNRISDPLTGLEIHWSGGEPFALCQLSGAVVDRVLETVTSATLASAAHGRCTRIDFAVDMETATTPEEFIAARGETRHASHGFYSSPTGTTAYVGSRKSERMARVYRYLPPHPRSRYLRAEVEMKGDAAKAACDELLTSPLTNVCLQAHLPFAWKHPDWTPVNINVSPLKARSYDKANDRRLWWFQHQVRPALEEMLQDGFTDVYDELERLVRVFPQLNR